MNKYLIFRNDRIGDFLISAILIKSIKRNDKKAHITVVASNKNFKYIKSFKIVDEVILFKDSLINKVRLIKKLRLSFFNYIIIHDNKNRSFFITNFLRFSKKLIIDKEKSHIDIIKGFLFKLNFDFKDEDLNTLDNRLSGQINFLKDYIIFHFDEKWLKHCYNSNYTNIEPAILEFKSFIKSIVLKKREKLIITMGIVTPKIISNLKIFFLKNNITIYEKINFFQLEYLVRNSNLLISCHGFVSHVAAANKIKQIDIIDKSYNYNFWTKHFRNYDYIYRDKFNTLYKQILTRL
jgi:ADP-heptose:LPS heptosyltransferase